MMCVALHVLAVLCAVLAMAGAEPAPVGADTDRDGVSDEVEEILGMDSAVADEFKVLFTRKPRAGRPDSIVEVALANAGGNRFVWRVQFAESYLKDTVGLVLFLDADSDTGTGRKDPGRKWRKVGWQLFDGCELFLRVTGGVGGVKAFDSSGYPVNALLPRAFVDGRYSYLSYDVDLKQENGKSVFRLRACTSADIWTTGYAAAQGPPVSDRPKLELPGDMAQGQNVERTYGPRQVQQVLDDEGNVRLPITKCELEGFQLSLSEYRANKAQRPRTAFPARITAQVTRDGTFYPGFVLHDTPDREVIGISVNGRLEGSQLPDSTTTTSISSS